MVLFDEVSVWYPDIESDIGFEIASIDFFLFISIVGSFFKWVCFQTSIFTQFFLKFKICNWVPDVVSVYA